MKTSYVLAALLAAGAVACSEKAPPPTPPKPKVEAIKPAEAPRPPEAPIAAPASGTADAPKK